MNHRLGSIVIVLLLVLGGCAAPEAEAPGAHPVRVALVDAPRSETAGLRVTLGRVDLVAQGSGAGVVTVADLAEGQRVLELGRALDATVGVADVPDGTYTRVRLVVDAVTLASTADIIDVALPDGDAIEIEIEPPLVVGGDVARELVIDFDRHRTIVETVLGSGAYRLEPTALRALSEAAVVHGGTVVMGTMAGIDGVRVDAFAAGTLDLIGTAYTDGDGAFAFRALEGGVYDLRFEAAGYAKVAVEDVTATPGVPLDLGLIDLAPTP